MNTLESIQRTVYEQINKAYPLHPDTASLITLSLTTDATKHAFGDLTSNAALVLAQSLQKSPRTIAETLKAQLSSSLFERVEIAGPGFINITLSLSVLQKILEELMGLQDQFFKLSATDCKLSYSIEFVSANPTGPLHLGHGRGGILGDVLGNILRFLGHTAVKEFYINDAGSQIKKLGLSFLARSQQAVGIDAKVPEDGYHGHYLVDLAEQLVAQEGKKVLEKPLTFFEDYSKNALLQDARTTLEKYGIHFDVWFSEKSLFNSGAIQKSLEFLTSRGYTYKAEDALWFASTRFGDDKDRVLKKRNDEYTYVASDVAYLQEKKARGADRLIIVLGQDHHSYVVRLKAIMEALGYAPGDLDVILYQLVTIKETGQNIRMSKRAGRIVSLEDVIDTVGTDVARFFYLHRKADAHLEFDIDLALKKTEENPVYYLQYAYVRIGSILEKAVKHPELENITNADVQAIGVEEKLLIKKIIYLRELLKNIGFNYQIHLLTYYAVELAQLFHRYYNDHRVIDLENPQKSRARIALLTVLRSTLKLCFKLLEISAPERM